MRHDADADHLTLSSSLFLARYPYSHTSTHKIMSSFKRARSPQRQDDSPSPSPTPSPTFKAARTSATPPPGLGEPSTSSHILCTLPPTCNPPNRPTSLEDTRDLEAHYAMYHAHVCEDQGCGCVFPDARLLELVSAIVHPPPPPSGAGALLPQLSWRGDVLTALCFVAAAPNRMP